jgi:hypothetical protein
MSEQLMILVAGPYRSGTNDDAVLIQRNVDAMEDMALAVFRRGHLPVLGEWFALPLLKHAGSKKIGDAVFDEIFHPIARELLDKCDAVLRIGGPRAAPTTWSPPGRGAANASSTISRKFRNERVTRANVPRCARDDSIDELASGR